MDSRFPLATEKVKSKEGFWFEVLGRIFLQPTPYMHSPLQPALLYFVSTSPVLASLPLVALGKAAPGRKSTGC